MTKENASAFTTSPPIPTIAGVTSCLPCLVAAFNVAGDLSISQVFWYNSTISLPLDTITVFLSEYGNTTFTSSSTVYGDITSLSESISAQVAIAEANASELIGGQYEGFGQYVLANGTGGAVPDGVTSFAYPTPYLVVAGFSIFTNLPFAGCPLQSPGYISSLIDTVVGPQGQPSGVGMFTVDLSSTFYSPLPLTAASGFFGFFNLSSASFSAFLESNSSLLSQIPYLASCSYLTFGVGPPALQIPATALTATVKTTVKENGPYLTNPPAPGSPIKPPVPPQTTAPTQGSGQGSPNQSSPNEGSPTQVPPNQGAGQGASSPGSPNQGAPEQTSSDPTQGSPEQDEPSQESPNPASPNRGTMNTNNPNPEEGSSPSKPSPSQQGVGSADPSDQGSGPGDSIPGSGNQDNPSQASNVPPGLSPVKAVPRPVISYAGTTIQPNEASQYSLPGIGTISPGGPGVTTNGIVYSLAPSATAIMSNGLPIPLVPITDAPAASPQPGILAFGGASYTADASSRFVIAGQTVAPAGPGITVSGTPIIIAPGGTAAVIGTTTVPIVHKPAVDMPNIAPVLIFAGSTYTASTSSAFVIEGQTLTPGSNIEVQGTPISYPSVGSEIVIGTSTEPLSFATITPPAIAPMFTYDGSTYTADSSSQFIIGGQTLIPGNAITVSGTPISYAAAASAVVIGTSTESLSFATITPAAAVLTFDGSTYTADVSSDFVINGQTLTPGGIITVSGTPISYAATGSAVVIGTSKEPLSYAKITPTAAVITFDGSTYTADESSDFMINGQTLVPGAVITISGTPISYASGGTDIVIGTSTEAVGIGGLIMSGLGGGSARTGAVAFTSGAMGERRWSSAVLGAAVALSICLVLI